MSSCIERSHANPCGSVDDCLTGRLHVLAELGHKSADSIADIDSVASDTEGVNEKVAVGDVGLFALRHENADNSVLAESFCTNSGSNGAVLASGDTDNSVGIRGSGLSEELPDPFDNAVSGFLCIKNVCHDNSSLYCSREQ